MERLASTKLISNQKYSLTVYIDLYNKRIRVDDMLGDGKKGIQKVEEMAQDLGIEKLIIKARIEQFKMMLENGYQHEASIDRYFLGSDCYFFCKYFQAERKNDPQWLKGDDIFRKVKRLSQEPEGANLPKEYELKPVGQEDANKLAKLYKEVFKIYPTPLHEPEYIIKTIEEGTVYYAIYCNDVIVSAASAEVQAFYKNAELTDCATLPEHRHHGLMKILLLKLEAELLNKGIFCAYSIARSLSFGMNRILHQLNYQYRGRLVNNCYIYDKLESMNVWVKDLSKSKGCVNVEC
jgi:putative beta-lysine N-acetyltransferase